MGAVPARTDGDSLEGARWSCAIGGGPVHLESLPVEADVVRAGVVVVRGNPNPALFYPLRHQALGSTNRPIHMLRWYWSGFGRNRNHARSTDPMESQ